MFSLPQLITSAVALLYLLIKVDFKPLITWAYMSAQRLYTMQSFLEESTTSYLMLHLELFFQWRLWHILREQMD